MSDLVVATLSHDEARSLTDEVKHDAERLWRKLVELYDGKAHLALGYSSWGAYFKTEFGGSRSRAYQLLDAGRVLEIAAESTNVDSPPNEAQARELAPLLNQPTLLNEAWEEAVESSNGKPTAATVNKAVDRRVVSEADREEMVRLRAQGTSVVRIAEIFGWSPQTVSKITTTPKPGRLARRQSSATAQTRALAKIHQTCREWDEVGDEDYIPAPELARRIRVLAGALAFLTKKRDTYKEVAPSGDRNR